MTLVQTRLPHLRLPHKLPDRARRVEHARRTLRAGPNRARSRAHGAHRARCVPPIGPATSLLTSPLTYAKINQPDRGAGMLVMIPVLLASRPASPRRGGARGGVRACSTHFPRPRRRLAYRGLRRQGAKDALSQPKALRQQSIKGCVSTLLHCLVRLRHEVLPRSLLSSVRRTPTHRERRHVFCRAMHCPTL